MTCIYSLLGARLNQWSFIATDISMATVQHATENVARNHLQNLIKGKSHGVCTYTLHSIVPKSSSDWISAKPLCRLAELL